MLETVRQGVPGGLVKSRSITRFAKKKLHPWRAEAEERGFRSSAAVPLLDETGQAFAIVSLYSELARIFQRSNRAILLRHIQQAMSHAILRMEQSVVISADLRFAYRNALQDGAVEMLYQPIIDLRTGKLNSLEALARLRGEDGKLIAPGAFLPAFGNAGLLRLFQLGLEQICKDVHVWREQRPELRHRGSAQPSARWVDAGRLQRQPFRDTVSLEGATVFADTGDSGNEGVP